MHLMGEKNIWDQAHSTMPCALHCNLLFIFTGTSIIIIYHGWFQVVVFEISHKCIYTFVAMSAMVFQGVHLQMCDKALPFLGKWHLHPHACFPQELCTKTIANKQPCCGIFTVRNLKDLWRCWKNNTLQQQVDLYQSANAKFTTFLEWSWGKVTSSSIYLSVNLQFSEYWHI